MRLIFDTEIEFLKRELRIDIPNECCWMNKMCVKVIDKNNKWHTLYRIRAKEMKLELIKDNSKILNKLKIKTWYDLIKDNKEKLNNIELKSLDIIKDYIKQYSNHEVVVTVSGGKDSSIVDYLVRKAIESYSLRKEILNIFSNTTNETHHTYKFVKQNYNNLRIITPKEGFYPLIKRTGFIPSRGFRQCCTQCKELPMIEQLNEDNILFFMGMRRAESKNRSEYEVEWKNQRWTNQTWQGILPILEFSDMEVWLYILYRDIPIGQLYKFGYNRLGCVNCCYRSDYELILNKEFLPNYYDRWQNILEADFIDNNKWINLNCTLQEYLNGAWKSGLIRLEPNNEVINEFATRNNLDVNIAKNYFNHYCEECDKEFNEGNKNKRKRVKDKTVLAMNMKFLGRNTNKFYCKKHLMELLNITKEQWDKYVENFKESGCSLF